MRNNPDVKDSHIVCAEVFIKFSLGNYSHYPQTAAIYLSGFQHSSILLSSFFGGTGIMYGSAQCGHNFYLVKIDADSHNMRKSGQKYCSRGV